MITRTLAVLAPLAGAVLPLADVPDPVFAQELVGPGRAILPGVLEQTVSAPISGVLRILTPHAFVVVGQDDRAVLVHLGVDAHSGRQPAAQALAQVGQQVSAAEPILSWLPSRTDPALHNACPVVALDAIPKALLGAHQGDISAGKHLFSWQTGGS
ncbi:PTS glucose transporter subunit IIA [Dactylosporangium sp. NPDC000244]|uniref:PTS sugar transporter subunit IIA n=1 Tax=Dactylosporangium sp. NPDC000244 TaxID=3154365 RepID=UPI0033170460